MNLDGPNGRETMRAHNGLLSLLFVAAIAVLAATGAIAQANEKYDKANALLIEGRKLADLGTDGSWQAAAAKFEESITLFIEGTSAEKKNDVFREVIRSFRIFGNSYIKDDRFAIGEKYLNFILVKVREAKLRPEMGLLIEDLGNSAILQGKSLLALVYYRQALPIHIESGSLERAAYVNRQIGLITYDSNKFDEAAKHFAEAVKLYRRLEDKEKTALSLADLGDTYYETNNFKSAESAFKEAETVYQELKDRANAAKMKVSIAKSLYFLYSPDEAVKYLQSAIPFFESSNDKQSLADALLYLGKAYIVLYLPNDARSSLVRAAEIFKELQNTVALAGAHIHLGNLELNQGNIDSARGHFEASLKEFTEAKNRRGIGQASVALAEVYSYANEHEKAFEKAEAALKIAKEDGSQDGLFAAYRILGWANIATSRFDEGIRNTNIAIKIAGEMNDPRRLTDARVNLGIAFSALGMNEEAIRIYKAALELVPQTNDRYTEAILFSNIGFNYFVMGDYKQAAVFLKGAIDKMTPLKMRREFAYATHNLGMVFHTLGDLKNAKICYETALGIYIEIKDRRPEAYAYQSLGDVYLDQKKWDLANSFLNRSILLAREIRYTEIEGKAIESMMNMWRRRGQPRLAVLYGKQAVNLFQSVRSQNAGLEKSQLASYVKRNEDTYRSLADILVSLGRLPEAQQVLDLLKEEEYIEFVRRDASEAADQAKIAMTESERNALAEYTRLSSQLTALGTRFQSLQDAKNKAGGKLPPEDEANYLALKKQIEEAGVGIRAFLSKLTAEFSKTVEDKAVITPASIETLRADLRRAGGDVILVSMYLLPDRYRAIVTTGRTMVDRKVEYKDRNLTRDEINRKIADFQRALQNPHVDPRPLGKELYDIFVKPLENDLRGAGAKTILWSLDGSLRYIPVAALSPDGKTYMAEHYQNVLVTLARQTNLFTQPSSADWRALGAGVSKPHEEFSALPSVVKELDSIVRENGSGGVLDGKKLIDEQFDIVAFRDAVPMLNEDGKAFNVIHLATHFKLGINDQDSALLLGDGTRLSLFEIGRDEALDFKDVELLALSACETGVAAGDGSGREVESLGMLAQRKGAKAVLATLWKVADEGTSVFMTEFYRLKKANPGLSKAEAIRLTQRSMIDGKIVSTGTGGGCRADSFVTPGKENDFKCDPNAPYSHPYFWSPFVLIGNWK